MRNIDPLNHLQGSLSGVIHAGETDYLYFGGTAYLGIPQNQAFLNYYIEGLSKFGVNNGTSRNNNVQLGIYDDAEAYAADYFGSEAALITSSGYLAAQLVVQYVSKLGQVVYAPGTHPALWLAGDPGVEGTFSDWAKSVVTKINNSEERRWVLISNAMNNLFPEVYDLGFLAGISHEKEILMVIDDSHGIG
ncbi:MAG: aminotransferase class I/II, partial [Pedobacter sp.]